MAAALLATLCLLAAGCAHEQVTRPPGAADIERINAAAQDNHWFRIEYVRPIASAQNLRVGRPIGIEAAGGGLIGFRTADDDTQALPLEVVAGVTVKDRGRGLLVGTSIGGAAAAVELATWYWFKSHWDRTGDCNAANPRYIGKDFCDGAPYITLAAAMLVTGAALGYLFGARRTFHFGVDR